MVVINKIELKKREIVDQVFREQDVYVAYTSTYLTFWFFSTGDIIVNLIKPHIIFAAMLDGFTKVTYSSFLCYENSVFYFKFEYAPHTIKLRQTIVEFLCYNPNIKIKWMENYCDIIKVGSVIVTLKNKRPVLLLTTLNKKLDVEETKFLKSTSFDSDYGIFLFSENVSNYEHDIWKFNVPNLLIEHRNVLVYSFSNKDTVGDYSFIHQIMAGGASEEFKATYCYAYAYMYMHMTIPAYTYINKTLYRDGYGY